MRLRTFTADTMQEALALVKDALGDDALILSTEEKKDGVHITAAIDEDSPPSPAPTKTQPHTTKHSAPNITTISTDKVRFDVQHMLRFHNLPEIYIAKMMATLSDAAIAQILAKGRMNIADESRYFLQLALEHACASIFQCSARPAKPHRLMLVGTSGAGKTLAIAKLATEYTMEKRKTLVISTDVNRAGGIEQLKSFTDILNVPFTVCGDKKSLTTALKMAAADTYVLIDTAGCNPYSAADIKELSEYADIVRSQLALVLPAGQDAQEAVDVAEVFGELPLSSIIATRADCARRFGGLLSAALSQHLPLSLISNSASVADNMTELNVKTLVHSLLKP